MGADSKQQQGSKNGTIGGLRLNARRVPCARGASLDLCQHLLVAPLPVLLCDVLPCACSATTCSALRAVTACNT